MYTIIKGHNATALSNAILISRAAAAVRARYSPGEVARSENYKSPAIVVGAFYTLLRAAPEDPHTILLHARVKLSSSVWPLLFILYTRVAAV